MTKFIITSIDSGKILAREKSPMSEIPNLKDKYSFSEWEAEFKKYEELEKSLKEYRLSEKSAQEFYFSKASATLSHDKSYHFWVIGQEISGEVINGEIHIK